MVVFSFSPMPLLRLFFMREEEERKEQGGTNGVFLFPSLPPPRDRYRAAILFAFFYCVHPENGP